MDSESHARERLFEAFCDKIDKVVIAEVFAHCNNNLELATTALNTIIGPPQNDVYNVDEPKCSQNSATGVQEKQDLSIPKTQNNDQPLINPHSNELVNDLDLLNVMFPSIPIDTAKRALEETGEIGAAIEKLLEFSNEDNESVPHSYDEGLMKSQPFIQLRRLFTKDEVSDEKICFILVETGGNMELAIDLLEDDVRRGEMQDIEEKEEEEEEEEWAFIEDSNSNLEESSCQFVKSIFPNLEDSTIKELLEQYNNEVDDVVNHVVSREFAEQLQKKDLSNFKKNPTVIMSSTHGISYKGNDLSNSPGTSTVIKIRELKKVSPQSTHDYLNDVLGTYNGDLDKAKEFLQKNPPPSTVRINAKKPSSKKPHFAPRRESVNAHRTQHKHQFASSIEEANQLLNQAQELGQRAGAEFKKGHRGTGSTLGLESHRLDNLSMTKYEEAASSFVSSGLRVLDFHGMPCKGARHLMNCVLREYSKMGESKHKIKLKLITGKGLHSDRRGPVIKTEILKILKSKELNYHVSSNSGVVILVL